MRLFPRFQPALNRRSRSSSFCRSPYSVRVPLCRRRRCPCFMWWWSCCYCFSFETLHTFLKLFLLCLASCSWSLLIISISLSTSRHPSKRTAIDDEMTPVKEKIELNPCLLCRTQHEGPSKDFVKNFHRPLKRILNSVNQLDMPLVPTDLRIHLTVLEVILVQLLKTLRVSTLPENGSEKSRSGSKKGVLSQGEKVIKIEESEDALKLIDKMYKANHSKPLACGDQFYGTLAGYPRYKKGFMTYRCPRENWGKSFTIIIWDIDKSVDLLKHWYDDSISIYLLTNGTSRYTSSPFVNIVPLYPSVGKTIRRVLRYVSTPYILLSPGLHSLRKETNFNRMIYVAEKTNVMAVSGSIRSEEDGKWKAGCQIFKENEGHLVFERSYSASIRECQLCHFAEGPVLLRTKWLIDSEWGQEHIPSDFVMPSLYFHLNKDAASYEHPILVCPDVMFRYNTLTVPWDIHSYKPNSVQTTKQLRNLWEDAAKERHLTQISLASGTQLRYPCHYLGKVGPFFYQFKSPPSPLHSGIKSGLRECQEFELKYILSRIKKCCSELKIACALNGEISEVLVHLGDPLRLLQRSSERPIVGVVIASGNNSMSLFREMLRTQDLKLLSKDAEGLIVEGKYWRVKMKPQERFSRQFYKRVHVMDSLWMNSEISASVLDPSFLMKNRKVSNSIGRRENSIHIQNQTKKTLHSFLFQRRVKENSKSSSLRPSEPPCLETGHQPDIVFNSLKKD